MFYVRRLSNSAVADVQLTPGVHSGEAFKHLLIKEFVDFDQILERSLILLQI